MFHNQLTCSPLKQFQVAVNPCTKSGSLIDAMKFGQELYFSLSQAIAFELEG